MIAEGFMLQEQIERKTYLKGQFKGKFIGYLDRKKSDLKHENFYNLEILSGEILVHKSNISVWQAGGEFDSFAVVEKFPTKFPDTLNCEVLYEDGEIKYFQIKLYEPKLINFSLLNQCYDKNKVLGDIEGEIEGYLLHYDVIETEVNVSYETPAIKIKTERQTGRVEKKGNYKRWEYYYSDKTKFWGDWIYHGNKGFVASLVSLIVGLIQVLFFSLLLIPLLLGSWRMILPFIIIAGFFYFFSFIQPFLISIWKGLLQILAAVFFLSLLYGIVSFIANPLSDATSEDYVNDPTNEVSEAIPDQNNIGDSIISHHRIWKDYNDKVFSGNLEVKLSDFRNSGTNRNNLPLNLQTTSEYNYLLHNIYDFDKNKLSRIYAMFDSIKTTGKYSEMQFAEIVTSCVQDIPYTLILDNACDPKLYNDEFVYNYLRDGGDCLGYTKYGILSPTEFMGSLKGDCDSRTLLLFTILSHYNYKVAILGSEFYKHSILAINLPYAGMAKDIYGSSYVLWETTVPGLEPGIVPKEVMDLRFWKVNLISNTQPI